MACKRSAVRSRLAPPIYSTDYMSEFKINFEVDIVSLVALCLTLPHIAWNLISWWIHKNPDVLCTFTRTVRSYGTEKPAVWDIKVTNMGNRPVLFTRFILLGSKGSYSIGEKDPIDVAYTKGSKITDIFPMSLEKGDSKSFSPITVDQLIENQASEYPWEWFVLLESERRPLFIRIKDVLNLPMKTKLNVIESIYDYFRRRCAFNRNTKNYL
jgi:hypothetical protein